MACEKSTLLFLLPVSGFIRAGPCAPDLKRARKSLTGHFDWFRVWNQFLYFGWSGKQSTGREK